jgi:DNA-binding NtrC family response regulator
MLVWAVKSMFTGRAGKNLMRTQVILVGEWLDLQDVLQQLLEDEGYAVAHIQRVTMALAVLRATPYRKVVLLGTRCGTGLLEAALEEPGVSRHAFVLVTALADCLPPYWRDLAERLHTPIVAKPFRLSDIVDAVAQAAQQHALTPMEARPVR